jgi:hypothetical protein
MEATNAMSPFSARTMLPFRLTGTLAVPAPIIWPDPVTLNALSLFRNLNHRLVAADPPMPSPIEAPPMDLPSVPTLTG